MQDRFYITTPIYYVNDVPHLGHAYTTTIADAFARYHAMRGKRTHFLTGTDEHGLKIERAAGERGIKPQPFVDEVSARFRTVWSRLNVEYTDFIRTTEPRHIERTQRLWKQCVDSGDIYLGHHEGWYCVACETFYTEKELIDGKLCPTHKKGVEWLREPSYFFRLSKYRDALVALYEKNPDMIRPEGRRNEVLSFLRGGLKDLSISRTSFSWGIPVPNDSAHVVYVWFDALTNYLSALGEGERLETFWPPDVHLIAKDILRFHTVFWQAFLLSAGFSEAQLPRVVMSHGYLTINGEKMGKSNANAVEPVRLAEVFGADEVRFYLLREIAFGQDGDFSHMGVINRVRSELAATIGNLMNRTLGAFVKKFFEGRVPSIEAGSLTEHETQLRERVEATAREAAAFWDSLEPHRALEAVVQLAVAGNKYFDTCAPWALAKDPAQRGRLGTVLYHVLETLRVISLLLWPVMPTKMNALRAQLGLPHVDRSIGTDAWPLAWGGLAAGTSIGEPSPLFRNITPDVEKALLAEFGIATGKAAEAPGKAPAPKPAAEAAPTAVNVEGTGVIAITDFEKVELRLGHVKAAEKVAGKDKLLKLSVDLGEPTGPRTIVAGIALSYKPEDLMGKQIVVVANLAPRKLAGIESHGMLLACGTTDADRSIVTLEKPVAAGTRVK